jgi:hypothetical protein
MNQGFLGPGKGESSIFHETKRRKTNNEGKSGLRIKLGRDCLFLEKFFQSKQVRKGTL